MTHRTRQAFASAFLAVPALLIGCEVLVDFDRTKIQDALNDASLVDQTLPETSSDAPRDDAADGQSGDGSLDAADTNEPFDAPTDAPTDTPTPDTADTYVSLPPVFNGGGAPAAAFPSLNEGQTTGLTASASDPNGDALTYTWTQISPGSPAGSFAPSANIAAPSWTAPRLATATAFTFRCVVSDGTNSIQGDVVVNVADSANDAPVLVGLTAGPTTVAVGDDVALSASATDVDGDAVSFAWTQTAGPSTGTFTNASSAAATWRAPVVSTSASFTLHVVASDGKASSGGDVVVTVNPAAFAANIQTIFTNTCIGCHDQNHFTGLDLRSGFSYALLVNVDAMFPAACTGGVTKRVVTSDADNSILWKRIAGTTCTDQMPLGGPPLSQANQDRIRSWILAGALNN